MHDPAFPIHPRIVYSPHYNIRFYGLERLHPFDSRKYGRAYALLKKQFPRTLERFTTPVPRPVSQEALLQLHTRAYLKDLKDRAYLARALELPPLRRLPAFLTDFHVLRPMRWATAGTILAARVALQHNLVFNLSGGYHHAAPDHGEGFCIYNDIALAILSLRREQLIKDTDKILYVDTDAHQGNGVCHAFFTDPRVLIYDIYNRSIYPAHDAKAKRRIDCNVPIDINATDAEYLRHLESTLPPFMDAITRSSPIALAIYNAGTDPHRADPLGALALTDTGILRRDQFVLNQLLSRQVPTLVLPSGGYTRQSYQLIANTISHCITTYTTPDTDSTN
ncbi:MAG TPA: histone deacetylase [Tepidisphaeraceae bacterium]|jgi:histone deacetylase 11